MTPRMSPARARGTRRRQLEADVIATAPCASSDEDFFREPNEHLSSWLLRREGLRRECEKCPVLTQCRELALRYDADLYQVKTGKNDCMVRGGLTAREIAVIRRSKRHSRSLAKAVLADRRASASTAADDAERTRISTLTQQLLNTSVRHLDPRYRGTGPSRRRADAAREAADELRLLRAARRRRNGWATAA